MAPFLFLILGLALALPAAAAEEGDSWLTLTWENDWTSSDSGYTNGIGIGWGRGPFDRFEDAGLPGWLQSTAAWLPYSRSEDFTHAVSYRVSQLMYTPDDIAETEVIEDDRPYAGVLLWTAYLHSWRDSFSNRYWMSLGAVGPISGAEQVQSLVHDLIGVNKAEGWDNQLDNEPVFLLANERLYRLLEGSFSPGWEYDLTGMTELMAGTLRSELGAGAGFRVGFDLGRTFPTASLIPGRNVHPLITGPGHAWFAFVNLYARYVFNDITLDGNYFSDSHSVELTNEQALYSVGLAWQNSRWGVVASMQESSRTFEERKENTLFGSVSVTFRL
jgi:hypothetical protein